VGPPCAINCVSARTVITKHNAGPGKTLRPLNSLRTTIVSLSMGQSRPPDRANSKCPCLRSDPRDALFSSATAQINRSQNHSTRDGQLQSRSGSSFRRPSGLFFYRQEGPILVRRRFPIHPISEGFWQIIPGEARGNPHRQRRRPGW